MDYEVGIIASNKTLNPINFALIPGESDGKVSTQNTRLEGMTDFIILPYTHTFMMNRPQVIEQMLFFYGRVSLITSGTKALAGFDEY